MSKIEQGTTVHVAKESVSDDNYIVIELRFKDGDPVKEGDILGLFETSKAVVEVESPSDGFAFFAVREEDTVNVGDIFAVIQPTSVAPEISLARPDATDDGESTPSDDRMRISKPAARLIKAHGLELGQFEGMAFVGREQVESVIAAAQPSAPLAAVSHTPGNRVIIVGGGGHTGVCVDLLRQMHGFDVSGIVYTHSSPGREVYGVPVLGGLGDLERLRADGLSLAVVGFGALDAPFERQKIFVRLKDAGFDLPNLIHPRAIIEPSAQLGEGNQVMAGAIVGSNVRVGDNCILNSGSVLSHDSVLGDNVHLTPGALVAGTVRVGDNSLVGMGASILFGVEIGRDVVVHNGARVHHDIPDGEVIRG